MDLKPNSWLPIGEEVVKLVVAQTGSNTRGLVAKDDQSSSQNANTTSEEHG